MYPASHLTMYVRVIVFFFFLGPTEYVVLPGRPLGTDGMAV